MILLLLLLPPSHFAKFLPTFNDYCGCTQVIWHCSFGHVQRTPFYSLIYLVLPSVSLNLIIIFYSFSVALPYSFVFSGCWFNKLSLCLNFHVFKPQLKIFSISIIMTTCLKYISFPKNSIFKLWYQSHLILFFTFFKKNKTSRRLWFIQKGGEKKEKKKLINHRLIDFFMECKIFQYIFLFIFSICS